MDTKISELSAVANLESFTVSLTINTWIALTIFVLLVAAILYKLINYLRYKKVKMTKMTLKVAGQTISFDVERNYKNLEIAHRIYIELVTRKAAIPIDQDKDIIVEVYNSWYILFKTTRDEIKAITGELLEHPKSESLISMATNVLNKGLRPHLTTYQGRFRRWYDTELRKETNLDSSPQEIQRKFSDYDELVASMKEVNDLLAEYANQLKCFIYGK